jgi:hypothetical protein
MLVHVAPDREVGKADRQCVRRIRFVMLERVRIVMTPATTLVTTQAKPLLISLCSTLRLATAARQNRLTPLLNIGGRCVTIADMWTFSWLDTKIFDTVVCDSR